MHCHFSWGFPGISAGKECACNVGDPSSIPGLGRSAGRRDRLPTPVFLGFPCGSAGKESTWNVGDLDSTPELRRCPGEGKGYPLQYSGLENSMDYSPIFFLLRHMEADFLPWESGRAWRLTWPKECGGHEALRLPNQVHKKPCSLPLPRGPPQSSEPLCEVTPWLSCWRGLVKSFSQKFWWSPVFLPLPRYRTCEWSHLGPSRPPYSPAENHYFCSHSRGQENYPAESSLNFEPQNCELW